jgi:hypothetical protein
MSKAVSVWVPCAYRTIGRAPWQELAESFGSIRAAEAGVISSSGSTVWYSK